jgi:hypothetical protein
MRRLLPLLPLCLLLAACGSTAPSSPRGPNAADLAACRRAASRAERHAVREPSALSPSARADAPGLVVALNAGGWGPCEPAEIRTAVEYVRLDTPETLAPYAAVGLKVIADESGPYDRSGVSGLDVQAFVSRTVALVRANPDVWAIEVLNEPGGEWFWGEDAESPANRDAYAKLIVAVHDALAARFGSKRPLILASYDGGQLESNAWGEAWSKDQTALDDADMLTEHPYGGTGERASASLGNRAKVQAAHAQTGKPIAITEVGWPTKGPNGNSLQFSEAEEAANITSFLGWARASGYVKVATIYNYRDTGEGGGYGVQTHLGVEKPAWFALARAAAANGPAAVANARG